MKGIQTHHTDNDFETITEYSFQIDGKWFKVVHTDGSVLDGRYAQSSDIGDWDWIGSKHDFSIVPTSNPEADLPEVVVAFVERFKQTGVTSGTFTEPHPRAQLEKFPEYRWGWEE